MKEKALKIGLFCVIVILAIIGFYQLADYQVRTTTLQSTALQASNSSAGTLVAGEPDPNTYSYNLNIGSFAVTGDSPNWSIPIVKPYQIYCINPGNELQWRAIKDNDGFLYTYERLMYLYETYSPQEVWCVENSSEVRALQTYMNNVYTIAYYSPSSSTQTLSPAAAYIISASPIGEWSEDKALAIWHLRDAGLDDGLIIGSADSAHDTRASIYDEQAADYAEYDEAVRDTGLNPSDKTDLNSVTTKVNQDTGEYTVGPFNMTYDSATYGDITFGGISSMVVIGYNSAGEEVRDDIVIEKIILKNQTTGLYDTAQTLQYFEPDADLKIDTTEQVYPASGQDFQIVFKDPNSGLSEDDPNRVATISIKVKFQYMLANGKYRKLYGVRYGLVWTYDYSYNPHTETYLKTYSGTILLPYWDPDLQERVWIERPYNYTIKETKDCHGIWLEASIQTRSEQTLMAADAIRSLYEQEIILGEGLEIDLSMDLGGHVWEDVPSGKENVADGQSGLISGQNDAGDRALPNVKVTLYTENGDVAVLISDANEEGLSDAQIMNRVNPTYTDSDGNYLFEGLDPMKKYYVTFEYNGQVYLPTEYLNTESTQYTSTTQMVNAGLYNTTEWKVTSKGTETESTRTAYNQQFVEIGSSPLNYVSSNSLSSGALVKQDGSYYNETFSQYDLMGFVLDEDGNYYKDSSIALVDGFYTIENGNIVETDELQEGIISTKIKEYILTNKKYPDSTALKTIYKSIAGSDTELWRKLQFIEDCQIESRTQSQGGSIDLYPVYSKFILTNNVEYTSAKEAQNATYSTATETIGGVTYYPLYPGQFFVNQGLWRRQEADIALRKDVAYAATRINGKTEVYTYDKRSQMTDEESEELARLRAIYEQDRTNTANYQAYLDYLEEIENKYYWEIQLRMRDYNNYYSSIYTREIYPADYTYDSSTVDNDGDELELYVTYKITIRNSSASVVTQIKEIVDYYDEDYIYMDSLSWIMYKSDSNGSNSEISVSQTDYYNSIDTLTLQGSLAENAKDTDAYEGSTYGSASQSDMESEYNSIYIRGLDDKKLASGEEAYIYLTFKVKSDDDGPVILDEDDSLKQNYVEINGYTTYYMDGTELPNNQTMSSSDAAGLIDVDSNPGNLELSDIADGKYEKNFEDDTDRAKSIKVTLDDTAIRSINGTVWEDERTQTVSSSVIGDGVRQDDEIGIQGVTVELVEILDDDLEYVWQTTTTDDNGYFEFKTDESGNVYIIPGNYIIRYHYGDTDATVLTSSDGGSNEVSYNGQDFKSTVYQKDMDSGEELSGYSEEYYNIQASDAFGSNLSDAKDIWSIREAVNNYSNNNGDGVTNHLAEVLASPYASTIDSELIAELRENTAMTAETAIIVLETEYNRTTTDGDSTASNGSGIYLYGNDVNGNYTLNNVDFGLTERPKAQLEISKTVSNVKITLANGTTLIDTSKSATDVTWAASKAYNLMDEMDDGKYNEYYGTSHRYAYRTEIDKLVAARYDASHNNGLIKVDMDDELMHGSTITITYALTVTNVSETDYTGQDFYYKGTGATDLVTTSADVVVDYVANNLQYRDSDNDSWTLADDVVTTSELSNSLSSAVEQFNTIITTDQLSTELKPGESTTAVSLVLSQLMTSTNSTDDRTYNNMVEITTISNSAGRRMAYSIQGNQDPTADEPAEVDSTKAEEVAVLPPTGIGEIVAYVAVAVGALAIIIAGIVFIKKKVLKK